MARPKRVFHGPDGAFVMRSAGPHGRRPILRLSEALLGRGAADQSFTFAFRQEDQLARFAVRRVDITAAKFMATLAQLYAAGADNPLLVVEGAKLQTGTGNSSRVSRGGQSFFVGHEAAHFGIGTFSIHGEAVSELAQQEIRELAAARGVNAGDIPTRFAANGQLTVYGMVMDADTFVAPAYFNRTEGLQEVAKQHVMLGLLPVVVPKTEGQLERALTVAGERVVGLLAGNRRAVVRPMDDRLRELTTNPNVKEFLQAPSDADNLLFGGRERDALGAMRDMVLSSGPAGGEYHAGIEQAVRNLPQRAADLAELAEGAREERG